MRVGPAEETWEATESGETQRGVVQTGEPGPEDEPYDTPKLSGDVRRRWEGDGRRGVMGCPRSHDGRAQGEKL